MSRIKLLHPQVCALGQSAVRLRTRANGILGESSGLHEHRILSQCEDLRSFGRFGVSLLVDAFGFRTLRSRQFDGR